MFLPQRVEPGSSRTGWCALPGSLPLRCHRFPMIRSPSQCPGTLRSSTSSGRSTSADHPHELGGCAAPTRLMRPASGALRAQHDSCGRASSPCHEGIEPWCRRPRGTPTTPFDCWGSPCTDSLDCHHKPPPGVPATIWRGVLERFKSASTRALRTRCGIEFCGSLVWTGVSGLSHQLPHGLIPTLPAVAAYPSRDTTDTDPHDPIRSPPQRASFLPSP